jgi:hypothetical protein
VDFDWSGRVRRTAEVPSTIAASFDLATSAGRWRSPHHLQVLIASPGELKDELIHVRVAYRREQEVIMRWCTLILLAWGAENSEVVYTPGHLSTPPQRGSAFGVFAGVSTEQRPRVSLVRLRHVRHPV